MGSMLDDLHVSFNVFDKANSTVHDENQIFTLCIGPKSDRVTQLLARKVKINGCAIVFFIEDFMNNWSVSILDGIFSVIMHHHLYGNVRVLFSQIYFRSGTCSVDSRYYYLYHQLVAMIDLYKGKKISIPSQWDYNYSKLRQINEVLMPLLSDRVKVPRAYVVKGERAYLKLNKKNLVVKSLSSMRSDVVGYSVFSNWSFSHLRRMPCLFQEAVLGCDVRVHMLQDVSVAHKIKKSSVNSFRYVAHPNHIKKTDIPDFLISFCASVLEKECSVFMGIDFLESEDGSYYCFEANPNPGWTAFLTVEPATEDPLFKAFGYVFLNDTF